MSTTPELVRFSIPLHQNGATLVGSGAECVRPLTHMAVADRHAEIWVESGKAQLRDLGTGTFVNGQRIYGRIAELKFGDQIDIGPFAFVFIGAELQALASMDYVQLTARNLSHTVSMNGKKRRLLQNISLVFRPGEFICILGPSGCGKSTLMAALSGRCRTEGKVHVNHHDLYEQFESIKQYMVLVPQKPVVHAHLTVTEALRYTAKLRLPATVDHRARVTELIAAMGLQEYTKSPVSILSGGQEKRLCLANELMSDPGLIFLDEVTSGLDESTDRDIMRVFRTLADEGKTVVCITHSLVHVPQCDMVVFLAPGGELAYFGPPDLAIKYFKNYGHVDQLGDIYDLLTQIQRENPENGPQWGHNFLASSEYATFVAERLPEQAEGRQSASPRPSRINLWTESKTVARQLQLLTFRLLKLLPRDMGALAALLGQVVLISIILGLTFGRFGDFPPEDASVGKVENLVGGKEVARGFHALSESHVVRSDYIKSIMTLTFLVGVISFWFGCNNAAREIVRERRIAMQEHFFNLRMLAYYLSKLFVLSAIGFVQTGILCVIVRYWCHPPLAGWDSVESHYLVIYLALSFAGTTLGLFLSAVSSTEQVAVALIPIAIVPQIILSGGLAKLSGCAEVLGQIAVTSYWGTHSMNAMILRIGDISKFNAELNERGMNLVSVGSEYFGLCIILIHSLIFVVLTLAVLCSDGTPFGVVRKMRLWSRW